MSVDIHLPVLTRWLLLVSSEEAVISVCGKKKLRSSEQNRPRNATFGLGSSGPLPLGRWTVAVPELGWLGADQTRRPKPYERQNRHAGCTGRWFEDDGRLQLVQFDGLRETVAFQIPPSHGPRAAGDVLRKGCVFLGKRNTSARE